MLSKHKAHCPKMNMNEKNNKQVPIKFPGITRTFSDAKKIIKFFLFPWTLEIIQFIRIENHMDWPRYLKKNLGYDIDYLSIWYSIGYGCFTARSMLKLGFATLIIHSVLTLREQIREN